MGDAANTELAAGASRLLVVDDSSTFRRAIADLLARAKFDVQTAASGEEAFERCLNEPFDAVVSDITMGALSGVQLCRLLRADPSTKDVPVVLLTAANAPRSRFWGRNAGAAAYVAKEHARDELVGEVRRVLETAPARGQRSHAPRAGRRAEPMGRLSKVLDDLLFRAVVSSEVRRLIHHTGDRRDFGRELLSIASDVTDYDYLVLALEGDKRSYSIHARGPWPEGPDGATFETLKIPRDVAASTVDVVADGPRQPKPELVVGDSSQFELEVAGEHLGRLAAFSREMRLGGEDHRTLKLLGQQAALLAKQMFLVEETRRLANNDSLTGLQNRRCTTERLETEMERARRHGVPLAVALCDIDHFKQVNDNYGHNMGDEVLRAVARAMAETVRDIDLVGRWGGEEFLLVLADTDAAGAATACERVRTAIASLPGFDGGPASVTTSVGVAVFREDSNSALFVDRADRALYRAKQAGRNRVVLAED